VSNCKHCGARNSNEGVIVFVNPIYTKVVEKELTLEQGTELLKNSCEISNQVHLVGMLCREPIGFHHDAKNLDITNYQLAVSRKFHILEDSQDNRVDFPWIKSYGSIAKDDFKFLKKGSYVLIDGMIQSRDIQRKQTCCQCGKEYEFNETAIDIVPYSTEYLRNFRTDEEIASQEVQERLKAVHDIFEEADMQYPDDTPEIPKEMYSKKKDEE
jgi:single-stranded DNA-binding protein